MTSVIPRVSDRIYRTAVEEFWWPLSLTDPDRVPIDIADGEATLIMVAGSSSLPPPLTAIRHPLEIDNALNRVGALLAGPDAPPTEGAVRLVLGQNRPWFIVQQGLQIFVERARPVYCV